MSELAVIAALAGLFGSGAGALAGYLILRSSGPVVTASALSELGKVRMEWQAWKLGAEGVLESLEEIETVIERKRARIAARESKAKHHLNGGPELDPRDPAALRARARAMGHPV